MKSLIQIQPRISFPGPDCSRQAGEPPLGDVNSSPDVGDNSKDGGR